MSDSDDSSEEMIAPTPRPPQKLPPGEADSDDSSDEVAVPATKVAAAPTGAKVVDESDEDDDDDEEEERATKAAAAGKAAAALKSAADEDEEDEDDEEDGKAKPKAQLPLATPPTKSSKGKGSDKADGKAAKTAKAGDKNAFKVCVLGLPWKVKADKLKESFADCGEILDVRIPLNHEGKSKGLGLITFSSQAGLDAILKYNGNTDMFKGRTLNVYRWQSAEERKPQLGKPQKPGRNILDTHMVEKMMSCQRAGDFRGLASLAQAVAALARTAAESNTGGGKSSADKKAKAIEAKKKEAAKEALKQHKEKKKQKNPPQVFNELEIKVSNLPFNDLDVKAVKKCFAKCGAIKEFDVPMKDGKSRGMASIEFESKEAVQKALALHETDFAGRPMKVKVKGAVGAPSEKPPKKRAAADETSAPESKKAKKAKSQEASQEEKLAEEEPPKKKKKKAKTEEGE